MQQETLTLVNLAPLCQAVDITVLSEPALCTTSKSQAGSGAASLFRRTHQTYNKLLGVLAEAGVQVEDPLVLHQEAAPRFEKSASLARLERSLSGAGRANTIGAERPSSNAATHAADVEVVGLPTRRIEVDYAVSRICDWVQDPATQYRYRDVAVIVRDLEPYHDLVSKALTSRGVPFFIDWRRRTAHHPLVELLRGAAATAAENLSVESVRITLKTGLLPIGVDSADELENYLLAHVPVGLDAWRGDDWSFVTRSSFTENKEELSPSEVARLTRINRTRKTFLKVLEPWLTFTSVPTGHLGQEWADAIVEWLERIGAEKAIESWADDAEQEGDLDQAAEHRQVWRDTMSFLEELAFAFADVRLSTEELTDILETGLSGLTLGLAPPTVDQVLVGSIERSRHPDIRAAVIVGFNDGVFPARHVEDSMLNDDDRTLLTQGGVKIGPSSRDRIFDESLLVYVAATRPSRSLVVTYAASDNEGKALRPSPFVEVLRAACPGLAVTTIADPSRSRKTWDILSTRDLTGRLVSEFRTRPAVDRDDRTLRARWNELYDAVRTSLTKEVDSRRALAALGDPPQARISTASVGRLYPDPMPASVSQLETYAACPFQHYAKYTLKLRERAEAALAPVDIGQVHHAVLEDFVKSLSVQQQGLGQLSDGEMLERLQESCDRVATRLPPERVGSSARDAYMLRRSASSLARVIRAQRNVAKAGGGRPHAAELPFGFDRPGSLPAMQVSTPAGRRVQLRGYIDRVDLAELGDELLGIVIDYKGTRDKRLNLGEVYHGLSLQLLGYLLVLAGSGRTLAGRPIRPIAAFYFSLAPRRDPVDHPSLASERKATLPGTFRPRGLIRADQFDVLDQACGQSQWSNLYTMYRKKDGAIGNVDSSDGADSASFQGVLDHTRTMLGTLADGILDGDVAVRPYRLGTLSPCSWCPMTAVCRFEMGICEARFLESLKRSEVFKRLAGASS
jgi:ATP-dependent helicase/nuclease subunit B